MSRLVVEYLNELLGEDRDAITALVGTRVVCKDILGTHSDVQVISPEDGVYKVGLLGILNGLVGKNADGDGTIVAHYDNGKITKFTSNCD